MCRAGTALSWLSLQAPRSPAHSTTTTGTPIACAQDRVLLGATAARASGHPLAAMPCTSDRSAGGFDESGDLTALKVAERERLARRKLWPGLPLFGRRTIVSNLRCQPCSVGARREALGLRVDRLLGHLQHPLEISCGVDLSSHRCLEDGSHDVEVTGVGVKPQAVAFAEEAIPMFAEADTVPGYHQPSDRSR
jgi:hypothetical protein